MALFNKEYISIIFKAFSVIAAILPGIFSYTQKVTTFTLQVNNKVQTIDNFGASGAWFSEGIGRYWPAEKKERIAGLLFSKKMDAAGNPLGIGLSAWRFNIGGGTAEQKDSSGIKDSLKRVECFLSPNGTYDWNRQQGYQWFLKKAKEYGVKNLVAFSNTPPVQFTRNGLGFKTEKDYIANLRDDQYAAYANFLTEVIKHFDKEGLHFNYVSPVNEPQWDWSNKFGQMNQEGSPWHNADIYKIVTNLDSSLTAKKLDTKIVITEAGMLSFLYQGNTAASQQIQNFFAQGSKEYIGDLKHTAHVIEGHSYFTDAGDSSIISVRSKLRDTAAKYNLPFWQSEYCMLGNGYKEGDTGKISAMDCALFLSKIIYHDLAVANATAWHFWNSYEPGSADFDTRYYLIALKINQGNTNGDFTATKNLWALGHYSRFIRPGMQRIITQRSDDLNDMQVAKDIMLSAFTMNNKFVAVAINYTNEPRAINLETNNKKTAKNLKQYVTSSAKEDNMKFYPLTSLNNIVLKPRSIVTITFEQ